jgi:hypothetical protein
MNVQSRLFKTVFCIISALAISTIFVIPLLVRPFKLSVSFSTDYQFNNIISVLITIILMLIGSFCYLRLCGHKNHIEILGLFKNVRDSQISIKHFIQYQAYSY